MYSVQTNLH